MLKKSTLIVTILTLFFTSCVSDDSSDYVALKIITNTDETTIQQGMSIVISILNNDENIPENGTLDISESTNSSVQIIDSDSGIFSETVINYTPNTDFYGLDTFQYTVCDGSNCSTGTVNVNVTPVSPVNYNIDAFPYSTLSEYNFFEGTLKDLKPVYGVLPYSLNSSLFSDYAKKKRFVWMPDGSQANYVSDYTALDFPVGAILIKNFYYENVVPEGNTKLIETRLMIKKEEGWIFANYLWNEEQTEANYTLDGSEINFSWVHDNGETKSVSYQVPYEGLCNGCHNVSGTPFPIGPKPQNLNKDYNYLEGTSNQLEKWMQMGYLSNNLPTNIVSTIDWKDESQSLDLRMRSYLDINCAHCHSDEAYCYYRELRFAFSETSDPSKIGVCEQPIEIIDETLAMVIRPGIPAKSVLHFRLQTTLEQYRMPLFGRTLQHEEAIILIEDYINSLQPCE